MKRLLLAMPFLVVACAPDTPSEGRRIYEDTCASCHGPSGRGNGPAARDQARPPADLTKIAARRDGLWPMLEVMSIIDGYNRRALPREGMPVFGDFLEGELVDFDSGNGRPAPTPVKLIALVTYLETLQDPPPTGQIP